MTIPPIASEAAASSCPDRLRAELAKVTAERDAANAQMAIHCAAWRRADAERDAAIRDRNEAIAASEAARLVWSADEDAALACGKPAKMTQADWVCRYRTMASRVVG